MLSQLGTDHHFPDQLDVFTDRERILDQFTQMVHSAHSGRFYLLAIKGIGGTGKTLLIEYLSMRVCPSLGWQTGHLAFAQSTPDFHSILEGLEDALTSCVSHERLKQYRIKRDEHIRLFDEYRVAITVQQTIIARESSQVIDVKLIAHVNAELRQRERQLRAEQSRLLLELIEGNEHPLCFFIDGYERLTEVDAELANWLWEELLLPLARKSAYPVLVVVCGWHWPSNPAVMSFAETAVLDDFDPIHVNSYLRKSGVFSLTTFTPEQQEELVKAFYDLTLGHPLMLSLAVAYFKELPAQDRTLASLQADRSLLDERARIAFLQERLLARLSEPNRTLLERGSVLRSFDQEMLQVLLNAAIEQPVGEKHVLDDRSYEHFLSYPFIKQIPAAESSSDPAQFAFHEMIRQVILSALRRLHPLTKEELHRSMVAYYQNIANIEDLKVLSSPEATKPEQEKWLAEVSTQRFKALLEYFYHALQVRGLQTDTFNIWEWLTSRLINRWRRQQAELLLALIRQLIQEGEDFFSQSSAAHRKYIIYASNFLAQGARWQEALALAEEVIKLCQQGDQSIDLIEALDNIGYIYKLQGQLKQALQYFQRALTLAEQTGNTDNIPSILNSIGSIYQDWNQQKQALQYFQRALILAEQVNNLSEIILTLNNIGKAYQIQGQLERALQHFQRALTLAEQQGNPISISSILNNMSLVHLVLGQLEQGLQCLQRSLPITEQIGDPSQIAFVLNNISTAYFKQGNLEPALQYALRALPLFEQIGPPWNTALALANIGTSYEGLGQSELALQYLQRALPLFEQINSSSNIAAILNNVGMIHQKRGRLEQALQYLQRALPLTEQVGNPYDIGRTLNNIGINYIERDQLEQALPYFQRALPLFKKHGVSADIAFIFNNIGAIYKELGKSKQALQYFKRALDFSKQIGNPVLAASILSNLGLLYRELGKSKQALQYLQRALPLLEENGLLKEVTLAVIAVGMIYREQGQLEQALQYLQRALPFLEELTDITIIAATHNNIGIVYQEQRNLEQSLLHFQKALPFLEQSNNTKGMALALNNIGLVYHAQGQLEQALKHFQRALFLIEQFEDPAYTGLPLQNMGATYAKQGQLEQALKHFQRALPLIKENNPGDVAMALINIGQTYEKLGETERALEYLQQALTYAKRIGNRFHVANTLDSIAYIYGTQENWKQAIYFYKQVLKLRRFGIPSYIIAAALGNLGTIYQEQEMWEQAIKHHKQALTLFERLGKEFELRVADELDELADCYTQLGDSQASGTYAARAQHIRESAH